MRCELYRHVWIPEARMQPMMTGYAGFPGDDSLLTLLESDVDVFGGVTYTGHKQGLIVIGWDSLHIAMTNDWVAVESADEDACARETEEMVDSALAVMQEAAVTR